jgi:diguanylate cyclase (GGDEF)-like protein/PAS domain S-box-containing protein
MSRPVISDTEQVLEALNDGVYFVDMQRRITFWNRAAEEITGFAATDVVGSFCRDNILVHVDDAGCQLCTDRCPLADTLLDGQARAKNVFLHHKLGHRVPVNIHVVPQADGQGRIHGALEVFQNRSSEDDLREELERLRRIALVDPLTGLANRRHIDQHLMARASQMDRFGWNYGLILLDVDLFKDVNDAYGHLVGDDALKVVARDLLASARATDLAGRWGGDEFIVVAANTDAKALYHLAERFRVMAEASVVHAEAEDIRLTVSVGCTMARAGESPEEATKRADKALYNAKAGGRNRVVAL